MTNNNTAGTASSINTAKRFRIIAIVAVVVFLIVFSIAGYFAWRNIAQVETFHARVAGHLATVSSPGAGRIISLPLAVGDYVAQDEELAVMEIVSTSVPGARVFVPIRAPMAGVVLKCDAAEGDTRTAGQPLLTIADPEDVWVEASIHETRIGRVKVGQPVRVRIRALRVSFPGRVESISPATNATLVGSTSNSTTVEIPVRIAVDRQGYILYPGMSAEVHVQLEPRLW